MAIVIGHEQISAQREHNKNESVFVRVMCITQRKIVSNIYIYVVENIEKMYSAKSLKTVCLT